MKKIVFLFFCLTCQVLTSQIKGIVLDKTTRQPIPYVSIWVERENNGANAEENGEFEVVVSDLKNNILFSALGYQKKSMTASANMIVEMEMSVEELKEVVVVKKYGTKQIEIGETDSPFLQANENGPRIDIKFFPYLVKYKKTKFIKQVVLNTDCRINEALLKLHLYRVNQEGLPGEELLEKDFFVTVNKGIKKTIFNLSSKNLVLPKEGIFVGFEKLKIEKNRYEKSVLDSNSGGTIIQTSFCPFFLYNQIERDFIYYFSGGEWMRKTVNDQKGTDQKKMVSEPAINLILTN